MIQFKQAGYMNSIGSVPSKSEQQIMIAEHKVKQLEKENISAIKIALAIVATMMVIAMITS